MDASKIRGDAQEALRRLAEPFFLEGSTAVYASVCCNRLWVGRIPSKGCRSCRRVPPDGLESVMFSSVSDLDIDIVPEQPPLEDWMIPEEDD